MDKLHFVKKETGSEHQIVLLHGYGANANDLAGIVDFLPQLKAQWFFVQAPFSLDIGFGMTGYAWFNLTQADFERMQAKPSFPELLPSQQHEVEKSLKLLKEFFEDQSLHFESTHIGGFSQGSMLSLEFSLRQPASPRSLSIFSGNYVEDPNFERRLQDFTQMSIFQSHGHQDPILAFTGAQKLSEALKKVGHELEFHAFEGAHEIPPQILKSWSSFIERQHG